MLNFIVVSVLLFLHRGICHPEVPSECPYKAQMDEQNLHFRDIKASFNAESRGDDINCKQKHTFTNVKANSDTQAQNIDVISEPKLPVLDVRVNLNVETKKNDVKGVQKFPFPNVKTNPNAETKSTKVISEQNYPPADLSASLNAESVERDVTSERQPPFPDVRANSDAEPQRIDVTGEHKFIPSGPGDQRGPCPGLNALANHNYLPHNGIATIPEFVEATNAIFGMGKDLGTILAIYGAVISGNVYSWSIGGPSKKVTLGSLFSQPQGLSFSHNRYEGDGSATRGDLYQYGDAASLQLSQFKDLLTMQNGTNANYDLGVINAFFNERLSQSKRENPYFFSAPISGLLVVPGAYQFIYRFMGNKTKEHPEGILNRGVLKSLYGVVGSDKNLTYLQGHERIPDNWYRYPIGREYTLVNAFTDLGNAAGKYPQILEIGGNTGKVDSFVGIDISRLTGATYNINSLLQGNNLACFAFQVAQETVPDILKGFFSALISAALAVVNTLFSAASPSFRCPQLSNYNSSLFTIHPGYTGLHNGSYAPHPPRL